MDKQEKKMNREENTVYVMYGDKVMSAHSRVEQARNSKKHLSRVFPGIKFSMKRLVAGKWHVGCNVPEMFHGRAVK